MLDLHDSSPQHHRSRSRATHCFGPRRIENCRPFGFFFSSLSVLGVTFACSNAFFHVLPCLSSLFLSSSSSRGPWYNFNLDTRYQAPFRPEPQCMVYACMTVPV